MASLNEVIHQPVRLRIMAALAYLAPETQASFNYLKGLLELTDGNLGAHLRKLEESGYIEITKTFVNNKPQTYVEATTLGKKAFREHVAALEEILNGNYGEEKALDGSQNKEKS
ncbi:MAG TPA: transcriptional regulator [Ktedonobacteraceae bacterium]|jgi:DNA-binding MarR family transcriptional regulator